MSIVNSIIDNVIKSIDVFKSDKQVDVVNLSEIFKLTMELVEHEPLSGEQKKETVITVVDHVLELMSQKNLISTGLYAILKEAVDTLGPYMIDLVVAASKKLVEINKEVAAKCKAGCFGRKKKN